MRRPRNGRRWAAACSGRSCGGCNSWAFRRSSPSSHDRWSSVAQPELGVTEADAMMRQQRGCDLRALSGPFVHFRAQADRRAGPVCTAAAIDVGYGAMSDAGPPQPPAPLVPSDFTVPQGFEGQGFRLEQLDVRHNERDYAAWTPGRRTRGPACRGRTTSCVAPEASVRPILPQSRRSRRLRPRPAGGAAIPGRTCL